MNLTLLVLAAGMGSRYGGLKQMDPMGPSGETVLDYSVFDAIRAGFTKVVFIIREDFAEAFKAEVGSRFADQIEVEYVFQDLRDLPEGFTFPDGRERPWGTSHAVLAARDVIDEPFAVINADDFYGRDGLQQAADALSAMTQDGGKNIYALIAYSLENTLSEHGAVNRGICKVESGVLQHVEEHTGITRDEDGSCSGDNLVGERVGIELDTLVSMNLWCFGADLLTYLQQYFINFLQEYGMEMKSECYIPTVVDSLISSGVIECRVTPSHSQWFGVTYPEDKAKVVASIQRLVDAEEYPPALCGSLASVNGQ